jgi:multidrug efflux pump subunit AcrB
VEWTYVLLRQLADIHEDYGLGSVVHDGGRRGIGAPGHEIRCPVAMVILVGLVTSTVLNLIVLPNLSFRNDRIERTLR